MNGPTEIVFDPEFDVGGEITRRVNDSLVEIRTDASLEELRVLHGDPSAPRPEGVIEMKPRSRVAVPVKPRASTVGRNEFCPCGSGRKFKRCCR